MNHSFMRAHQNAKRARMSSSFLATSCGVRSSSSDTSFLLAMEMVLNSSIRSPSSTYCTGGGGGGSGECRVSAHGEMRRYRKGHHNIIQFVSTQDTAHASTSMHTCITPTHTHARPHLSGDVVAAHPSSRTRTNTHIHAHACITATRTYAGTHRSGNVVAAVSEVVAAEGLVVRLEEHLQVHTHTRTRTRTPTHLYTCAHPPTRTDAPIWEHTHAHTHAHAPTHTYAHTRTHTPTPFWGRSSCGKRGGRGRGGARGLPGGTSPGAGRSPRRSWTRTAQGSLRRQKHMTVAVRVRHYSLLIRRTIAHHGACASR